LEAAPGSEHSCEFTEQRVINNQKGWSSNQMKRELKNFHRKNALILHYIILQNFDSYLLPTTANHFQLQIISHCGLFSIRTFHNLFTVLGILWQKFLPLGF
jgi:hypothetical protein